MDRSRGTTPPWRSRLPRACGDGPVEFLGLVLDALASPRLRGWTPRATSGPCARSGFPAPAGMDPASAPRPTGTPGLPRACGDGPSTPTCPGTAARASPRLRGWTLKDAPFARQDAGFPAPAGMDRAGVPRTPRARGLPRACGDGPCGECQHLKWIPGFPAPAGMDLLCGRRGRRGRRLPRACGDGPPCSGLRLFRSRASPRLRGWTAPPRPPPARRRGFPAPAGMDRPGAERRGPGRRLPRACGDGPIQTCRRPLADRASPRLRGWTPPPAAAVAAPHGFPAPAGMDPGRGHGGRSLPGLPRACGDGPV